MLFRRFARRHSTAGRRNFASVKDTALKRYQTLQNTYPGIFNSGNFMKEQQTLIDANFKGQSKMIDDWNKRAIDMQDRGIRFFYEIGGEKSAEALPEFQPPPEKITKPEPLSTPERDWATLQKRFDAGEKLVASLDWLKDHKETKMDDEQGKKAEENLKLIEAFETLENLDDWQMRLETEADVWKGCKLPATEFEYMMWLYEYKKTAPFIGNMDHGSSHSHLIAWDKLTPEETKALKAHIEERETQFFNEVVKKNDPTCTKDRWMKYHNDMWELFTPWDLDHYNWMDHAKNTFRAAYWQGPERVAKVEQSFKEMLDFIENDRDSEIDLMRLTYQHYPECKFRPEASQRIQARDLQVVPKMLKEIRDRVDASTFERSMKDVLKPNQKLVFEAEQEGLQRGMDKRKDNRELEKLSELLSGAKIPDRQWNEMQVYEKHMEALKKQMAEFDKEPLTVEQVAREVVPTFCWALPNDKRQAAIDKFTEQVITYCKKGGKMAALDKAYWDLMPHNQGEEFDKRGADRAPDDIDHVYYMVKHAEVREWHPEHWSTWALLQSDEWDFTGNFPWSEAGVMRNIKLVQDKLQQFDPICLNLLKCLLEEQAGLSNDVGNYEANPAQLREIFEHYQAICQKLAGEVHGQIVGAEDMSDKDFNAILAELKKGNPKKKFFMEKKTDPALMAGFIVKAGTQTLDFSLLNEIESFKEAQKAKKTA